MNDPRPVQSSNVPGHCGDSSENSKSNPTVENDVKEQYTCMSCDKIVSNIQLHLKNEHNIDCFQVVDTRLHQSDGEQTENLSTDVSQSDIKSEIFDDDAEDDSLDCVSLAELEGYLPATDYAVLKGERKVFFVCKSCESSFDNFVSLKDHSIIQHNNIVQRRDCRHCDKMLDSHKMLMEHLKENHVDYRQLSKIQKIIDRVEKNGLEAKDAEPSCGRFSCSECGKVFRLKSSLALHRRRMHSTKKLPGKDGKMTFWCLECRLDFPDVRDLRRHRSDNHGERSFLCVNCDTVFPSRGSLNLHNIYHHRIHWCSTCNVAFPGRLALTSHVKQEHPGMPVYRANSKFVCEYCSQSFSIRTQLSDHIQSVHLGLINRCEDCGKILATSETLKVHRLKHRPEMHRTCEHCGRQFYRTGMLTEHIRACHPEALPDDWRLHTTCPYCQTSFTRRESMRRHIEAKHEPKSLSCSYCERLFTCRRYLVRHENKHHLGRATH